MEPFPTSPTDGVAFKRPVFATILFVLFCLGVPVWLFAIGSTIFGQNADSTLWMMSLISLAILILRGVGMVRLFLMKPDAWVPMAVALIIELPVVAVFFLRHRLYGVDLTKGLLNASIGWVIAVGVIVYAYRVTAPAQRAEH